MTEKYQANSSAGHFKETLDIDGPDDFPLTSIFTGEFTAFWSKPGASNSWTWTWSLGWLDGTSLDREPDPGSGTVLAYMADSLGFAHLTSDSYCSYVGPVVAMSIN